MIALFSSCGRWPAGSLVMATLLAATSLRAGRPHGDCPPNLAFTNLAALLLNSELGVSYGRIQLHPTNEYTPAVHRLLQVAANVHEAARPQANLPAVFKPRFVREGDAILLADYDEVETLEAHLLSVPLDLSNEADRAAWHPLANLYGVPWIIGARTGLPNFNEVSVETLFEMSRKMRVGKQLVTGPPTYTNQAHVISVGSAIGVEAWNPYRQAFTNGVDILVTNRIEITLALTNQPSGLGSLTPLRVQRGWHLPLSHWPGSGANPTPLRESFLVWADTNLVALTHAVFRMNGELETAPANLFLEGERNLFPTPEIWLSITNNLQFVMLDHASGRVIDYVQLKTGGETNLTAELDRMSVRLGHNSALGGLRDIWNAQRLEASEDVHVPTLGVRVQLGESMNLFNGNSTVWRDAGGFATGKVREEIVRFVSFMAGLDRSNLLASVPFTPTVRFRMAQRWEANDPLLHSTTHDLSTAAPAPEVDWLPLSLVDIQSLNTMGRLNQRYEPWGGNPAYTFPRPGSDTRVNVIYQDPLVRSANDWDFPSGGPLSLGDLGRIHRGTPWQTLYLKSSRLDTDPGGRRDALGTWSAWTGVKDRTHAAQIAPSTDWHLVATLIHEFWPEKRNKLLSVNEPHTQKWLHALDGIEVWTNTTPDAVLLSYPFTDPSFEPRVMSRKSDQASAMVDAIHLQRTRLPWPGGYFPHASDILSTPALSVASPWLNLSATQTQRGINDAAYEAVPLQLLTRLRSDSIGAAVLKNGRYHLRFTGHPGATYVVETSTDMIHWTPLTTRNASHQGFECDLPPATGDAARFFRSRRVPEDNPHPPQGGRPRK